MELSGSSLQSRLIKANQVLFGTIFGTSMTINPSTQCAGALVNGRRPWQDNGSFFRQKCQSALYYQWRIETPL
jgi:hypothetical protein